MSSEPSGSVENEAPGDPAVPAPPTKASGSRSWINVLLGVALVAAVGGVSFAAGRVTAPARAFPDGGLGTGFNGGPGGGFNGGPNASGQPGGPGGGFLGGGGITLEGTVESISGNTLTVRTANGQTLEVTVDADTEYHEQAAATGDDVETGATVQIRVTPQVGSGNGGSFSATDVTVVP